MASVEEMDVRDEAAKAAYPLPTRFIDREASWLDFNDRVLQLAEQADLPALERLRFLAIFAKNLDEFFMVRVAKLRRRVATGIAVAPPSGLTPIEQLQLISRRVREISKRVAHCLHDQVLPLLAEQGIELVRWEAITDTEREELKALFDSHIHPVLTPLAVDPAHPFPYISGLSLNLAVMLRDPQAQSEHFARVKVPPSLPRFLPLGNSRFVPLEEVIAAHLPELFAGMEVLETHTFRVTRNEDLEVEEDDGENLLRALEKELLRRKFGPPVRLEVEETMTERVLNLLVRELDITVNEVFPTPGPLDLGGLWAIADLDRPELKYPTFVPATPRRLLDSEGTGPADMFSVLKTGDVLVHHPYDSFATSVQSFLEQAAADPSVLAIKQTLYRTSGDSPIVDALVDAAEAGKQVLVVVEIKARWDEQANIQWARALEKAGCHVVYGLIGLKTHCKLSLVIREEADGRLARYAHIGTGNYNPKTARIYEDFGLLTADPEVGADVADLFNHISGYTRHRDFDSLLVAPDTLRPSLVDMIRRERRNQERGRPAGITFKMNALVDEEIIDELYAASQAGVPIEIIVRGMCALRPGLEGLSETVRVRSILGRFLEHSRVFRFCNGGDEEIWTGSADIMHRNLDRRVEALVRVQDTACIAQLDSVLDLATADDLDAWVLDSDGIWARRASSADRPTRNLHTELIAIRQAQSRLGFA